MTTTNKISNVIFLRSGRDGDPAAKEAYADAAITPGMLCELTSTGIKKHATAGGNCAPIVAIEDIEQGNDIDTDYTAANRVHYRHCAPGDELQMFLADGQSVAVGDFLESAGNGYLRKHTAIDPSGTSGTDWEAALYYNAPKFIALEAKVTNTSTSEALRMKVLVV